MIIEPPKIERRTFSKMAETILGMARGGLIALYHSPAIERELQRTLHDKFRWMDPQVRDALLELRAGSHRILPTVRLTGVMQDDTDHRIIQCAVAAQVEYLITGDKRHLQPLKHFRGIGQHGGVRGPNHRACQADAGKAIE